MIRLAAVLPHPPILLPEVGRGRESQAQATLDAYDSIANHLQQCQIQRCLMISTHGIVTLNRFHLLSQPLSGDLRRFTSTAPSFARAIDHDLNRAILQQASEHDIPLTAVQQWERSDHSLGVPINLLAEALPDRIGVVSISFRSAADHFQLGRAIGRALANFPEPTALLASGDAVHRLSDASEYGFHQQAEYVQQTYEDALTGWNHEALIQLDEDLRREVDESVISPTLILMGAMSGLNVHPRMLSSERPWGVGYVTALATVEES